MKQDDYKSYPSDIVAEQVAFLFNTVISSNTPNEGETKTDYNNNQQSND